MKASDLRAKSAQELDKELIVQLEDQFKLRMRKATGQLSQSHELKKTRRAIARIKTVLREKSGN